MKVHRLFLISLYVVFSAVCQALAQSGNISVDLSLRIADTINTIANEDGWSDEVRAATKKDAMWIIGNSEVVIGEDGEFYFAFDPNAAFGGKLRNEYPTRAYLSVKKISGVYEPTGDTVRGGVVNNYLYISNPLQEKRYDSLLNVVSGLRDSLNIELKKLKDDLLRCEECCKKNKGASNNPVPRSSEIGRINQEMENTMLIIKSNDFEQIFKNPYLASALYYSDDFLAKISQRKSQTNLQRKIIANIAGNITEEFRLGCFAMLTQKLKERTTGKHANAKQVSPLGSFSFGHGEGNHPDAIDLFTKEGSPVYSMSDGVVVLIDSLWDHENLLSVTSIHGGNAIIIFNPDSKEFYRYAHLDFSRKPLVQSGSVVFAGDRIGAVGHSGINASKPGHGEHLHLEINKYNEKSSSMKALSVDEIKLRIKKTQS